jgi:hypothetical protein
VRSEWERRERGVRGVRGLNGRSKMWAREVALAGPPLRKAGKAGKGRRDLSKSSAQTSVFEMGPTEMDGVGCLRRNRPSQRRQLRHCRASMRTDEVLPRR